MARASLAPGWMPALDLGSLPATQDEISTACRAIVGDGSQLGRFEFLYGCVVAEPPAGWRRMGGST